MLEQRIKHAAENDPDYKAAECDYENRANEYHIGILHYAAQARIPNDKALGERLI